MIRRSLGWLGVALVVSLGARVWPNHAPPEIVVKWKTSPAPATLRSLQDQGVLKPVDPSLSKLGISILNFPPGSEWPIEWAHPAQFVQTQEVTPNDPQWALQYGPRAIQAPLAWEVTTGTLSVTIAIIDTGVDLAHPDLATQIWMNLGEVGLDGGGQAKQTNGVDDDGNGYVDDWRGWDFAAQDNDPQDERGHGTHVAGIAAAAGDNSVGIAGVAWGVTIMPLKIFTSTGLASNTDAASAMVYAVDNGARIINLSVGDVQPDPALEAGVNYAVEHGALVVAAAGNFSSQGVVYPGAYPNALAVAAVDIFSETLSTSSYGPQVDLAAPGGEIYSTYWSNTYNYLSGTSMATPHVSGVAALLASRPGFETPEKIRLALEATAFDLGAPCWDTHYGFGLVQALAALNFDPLADRRAYCGFLPMIENNTQNAIHNTQ